ncbi:OmpA family protein [Microbulbifer flavimaris]|uniref:OmpA family protein n=1 Tax=Microbulbifer flavimaris TaxID=1781068 RepID=A0ABX4I0T8_9GAMM|nr:MULTISPECIES: OmpA family protein [Microbulbifer]PCO05926.1 OmpA family protein [Microbulbifer flavimaris]
MVPSRYSLFLIAILFLVACYDDPHKKYTLEPSTPGELAGGSDLSFGDTVVRYLRGDSGEGEFVLGVDFDPGRSTPKMDTTADVEALLVIMRDFPTVTIVIEGHTDSQGEPEKNQRLSQWRAEWVKNFLVDRGIAPERVVAEGFGDTVPIADNSTQRGQEKNRRLVVRIEKRSTRESKEPVKAQLEALPEINGSGSAGEQFSRD